jgi:UDP-2,3-diacylglucosamine hydrolase
MSTLFISDLHLTPDRPESTEYFIKFMHEKTKLANTIFVLGDLFEYWVGDDATKRLGAHTVIDQFKRLADAGVRLYFMPGNRDFLVGKKFCTQAGFEYLHDESRVTLNGHKILLLHGDSLCTDDVEHQKFRLIVNQKSWQKKFLDQPIESRIEQAMHARAMSNSDNENYSESIMDVTESAVISAFNQHSVKLMVHGHTHRPKIHKHQVESTITNDNTPTNIRIVLGDWYEQASYLELIDEKLTLYTANQSTSTTLIS